MKASKTPTTQSQVDDSRLSIADSVAAAGVAPMSIGRDQCQREGAARRAEKEGFRDNAGPLEGGSRERSPQRLRRFSGDGSERAGLPHAQAIAVIGCRTRGPTDAAEETVMAIAVKSLPRDSFSGGLRNAVAQFLKVSRICRSGQYRRCSGEQ